MSLVICTRDRSQQLARCLQSVQQIIFERCWEVVIVDNGSIDETAMVVEEVAGTSTIPVVYVLEKKPGLANAHNAALRAARGDILAFIDDDCYPAHDFLSKLWVAFENPFVGYISGRILLHDPTDCPLTINESITHRIFSAESLIRAGDVQGANMSFRRQILLDIGGFDPLFGPGSRFNAEDVEAASRASLMGWIGLYYPEAIVRHHHGRKTSDRAQLERSYALGRGAYHMKLLLHARRFMWFARSLYELCWWRARWYPGALLWETLGGAQYAYLWATGGARRNKSFASRHGAAPTYTDDLSQVCENIKD